MQNEKSMNRSGQVRRNPSRDNKNINQGQNYEKERVDIKTNSNGDAETNQAQFSGNESPLDGNGISDTAGSDNANQRSGKTQQNTAGKNQSNEQTGSTQGPRGTQGANSQSQSEQQQSKNKSGESSLGVNYDANDQFDYDEDFGSHNDKENSTRQ